MSRRIAKGRRPDRRSGQEPSPWAVLLIMGGLLLLGGAAYFVWGNGAASPSANIEVKGSPRLQVDQDKIDLGEIKLGQTVEARFQLTNVGDQPLRFAEKPYIEIVEGC